MPATAVSFSNFAQGLVAETAFDVLAVAKKLKAAGKDVIELQIGDSPFPSSSSAIAVVRTAIEAGATHYCPSIGLPEFRKAAARLVESEFGIPATLENIVAGPGAKVFETYFCELFVNPGDAVLVFGPTFPTYEPNIVRRGGIMRTSALRQEQQFRPNVADVERFVNHEPRARAIILNTPHNPTGGVATRDDIRAIADLIRGRDIALFSDEPYCHMAWSDRHYSILAEPGMMDHCVAAYTFSKSYSMSGWRLGFAVSSPAITNMMAKMVNTSLSCVPPFVQLAGAAALEHDAKERDEVMQRFHKKVELLVRELESVDGVKVLMPAGTFYVFPRVQPICERLRITSHGLAMYLLEGADDQQGVACLGGECFGPAGAGFIRFSCAEPDERLVQAIRFFREAITRTDRVAAYLAQHPKYRLG